MLNTFFASLFTTESVDELPDCENIFHSSDEDNLSNYHISPSMVKAKLLKLKMNKAPGPRFANSRPVASLNQSQTQSWNAMCPWCGLSKHKYVGGTSR